MNTQNINIFRDQIEKDVLKPLTQKNSLKDKLWLGILIAFCLAGFVSYIIQLNQGLEVTGMRDKIFWGIYIATFVFFVAVSLVGALMGAILKLLDIKWRYPLIRIAELITVVTVIFAALAIVVDMGRPDRILNILIHGRIQSPIIWDIIVVNTYLITCLLLLYIPMIPDLATCRDKLINVSKWRKKLYSVLALNWQNTPEQQKIIKKATRILVIFVIPVAIAIHTVTAWLFAVTFRPGWDSSVFGPYFVSGAFLLGAACVVVGMWFFRKHFKLNQYINEIHFDYMGKLILMLSLVYLYFNLNEFIVPGYKMATKKGAYLADLFTGEFAITFWTANILGMLLPVVLLLFKKFRQAGPLTIISLLLIVGAWLKRYIIVVPTLYHPLSPMQTIPDTWQTYIPTVTEILITLGLFSGVLLLITLFGKIFPILPMNDLTEQKALETQTNNTGHIEILPKIQKLKIN